LIKRSLSSSKTKRILMDFPNNFVTFTVSFQSAHKNFQLNSSIASEHFLKLLHHAFQFPEPISPENIYLKHQNSSSNQSFDIMTFCKNLPYLINYHKTFTLFLNNPSGEEELISEIYEDFRYLSPKQMPMNHFRTQSAFKNDSFKGFSSPLQQLSNSKGGHFSSDRLFLRYLDQMLDENKLQAKEFYFIKCLFFERRGFVLDFLIEALRDQDYNKFSEVLWKLLEIKNVNGMKNHESSMRNPSENIMDLIKRRFSFEDAETLRGLIVKGDSTMISCIELFNQEEDEDELVDTMMRVLSKFKSLAGNTDKIKKREAHKQNNSNLNDNYRPKIQEKIEKYEEKQESQVTYQKKQEKTQENSKNHINPLKETEKEAPIKEAKQEKNLIKPENLPKNLKIDSKPETSQKPPKKESMLAIVFKTFLEETEDQFEAYEIGFARYLFSISSPPLLNILNTVPTIEAAVLAFKSLIEEFFTDYLNKNFTSSEDIEYIQNNKGERANEICSIFFMFKNEGKLEMLTNSLTSVIELKKGEFIEMITKLF